ncbi:MAG: energy-coupling factor transporter transmembrane protein EcfT [Clostridia bacterium]|nr:energy-coupling factor transporter transmembrane protein EcfT [Clostridia bacterium]
MLKDVTFGQYYPVNSFAHKSDPRIKLLALIAYIVALFLAKNFYGMAVCFLVLVISIIASRVPLGKVLRSVKGILILLAFTAILNLFFHGGEILLVHWKFIKIYQEGIIFTVFLVLRLFFLVMGSALLTLTTTPVELTDGIESLLTPLKWVRFPVHELALIMSIALRFIPTLIDETNRIISAQKARGADFESGNLFKRIKAVIPILIPLLISAFRRAEELGDAMDARCYSGSKNRTKYKKLTIGWRDVIIFLLYAAMVAGVVLFNIYAADIFPQIYEYIRIS